MAAGAFFQSWSNFLMGSIYSFLEQCWYSLTYHIVTYCLIIIIINFLHRKIYVHKWKFVAYYGSFWMWEVFFCFGLVLFFPGKSGQLCCLFCHCCLSDPKAGLTLRRFQENPLAPFHTCPAPAWLPGRHSQESVVRRANANWAGKSFNWILN